MNTFFTSLYAFFNAHILACAFIAAMFVSSLPKPGTKISIYEFLYTFLNGIMANIPQTKAIIQKSETSSSTKDGNTSASKTSSIETPIETKIVNMSPLVEEPSATTAK